MGSASVRATVAALLAALCVAAALAGTGASEEEEGGPFLVRPLDIEILSPANGSAFRQPNVSAIVEADGASASFYIDGFVNGTFVNASFDGPGLRANATAPTAESYYVSRAFELPAGAAGYRWVPNLDMQLGGPQVNATLFLSISVRFGERTDARNWSEWLPSTIEGDFDQPNNTTFGALLSLPAFQYRVAFTDPPNASSPNVVFSEVWYKAPVAAVEARLLPSTAWTLLGTQEGRFTLNVTLPEGESLLEARVSDIAGNTRYAHAALTFDPTGPAVASAPQNGSSIPPDTSAVIIFSEPVDLGSAKSAIVIDAPFGVDAVWSADNTTLFLSAQESGARGLVNVTIGPGLADRLGNRLGTTVRYTYEMGKPPESGEPPAAFPVVPFVLFLAALGLVVVALGVSAQRKKEAYAREERRRLEEEARKGQP